MVGDGRAMGSRREWSVWWFVVAAAALWTFRLLTPVGSTAPEVPSSIEGVGELASDPEWVAGALLAELRIDGHRVTVWARGPAAGVLADRLMGERVWVSGNVKPRAPEDVRAARRGVAGSMSLATGADVRIVDSGNPPHRLANAVRRTLERGTAGWSRSDRSLFLGLVLGDDRGQSPEQTDRFRATGLTHLIVVSGQNVAFFLVLVRPLLLGVSRWPRLVATLGCIGFFALLTRFEASVLRASVMAGLAAWVAFLGRPADRLRLVALAVVVLLVVDGSLAFSLGFGLSVAATLGILVWAGPLAGWLARRWGWPRWLAEPVGVTGAAQLATAPLLVWFFEGVPWVALPANVLAGPVAGFVMMWGLSAGLVAGVAAGLGLGWVASLVHWPTRVLLGWLEGVAGVGASVGLGSVGLRELVAVVVLVGLGWVRFRVRARSAAGGWWVRFGYSRVLPVAMVATVLVGLGPVVVESRCAVVECVVAVEVDGVGLTRSAEGAVVVELGEGVSPGVVLAVLRRYRVVRVDLVVAGGYRSDGAAVATVQRRFGVVPVLAKETFDVAGRIDATVGRRIELDDLVVTVISVEPQLTVQVVAGRPDAAANPDPPGQSRPVD